MYVAICPHCDGVFIVEKFELNCKIFRHGSFKSSNEPIPPHSSKLLCDSWASNGLIWGCGKPFIFDGSVTKICDYI